MLQGGSLGQDCLVKVSHSSIKPAYRRLGRGKDISQILNSVVSVTSNNSKLCISKNFN